MHTEKAAIDAIRDIRADRKYFDLDEANRAVPYISRIVHDLIGGYRRVVAIRRRIEREHSATEVDQLEARYESAMERLGDFVDELHMVGVELKDFEKGMVDFPALHQGRMIYLCWRYGEPRIEHWHEVDQGLTGSQSVELLATADCGAA